MMRLNAPAKEGVPSKCRGWMAIRCAPSSSLLQLYERTPTLPSLSHLGGFPNPPAAVKSSKCDEKCLPVLGHLTSPLSNVDLGTWTVAAACVRVKYRNAQLPLSNQVP